MTLARYLVSRQRDEWLVSLDGRPVARHGSRSDAVAEAIGLAAHMGHMDDEADVVVASGGGVASEPVWSFRRDPLPGSSHPIMTDPSRDGRGQRTARS